MHPFWRSVCLSFTTSSKLTGSVSSTWSTSKLIHGNAFFGVRFPKTAQVRRAVDYHQLPTNSSRFDVLFPALQALAQEVMDWFE